MSQPHPPAPQPSHGRPGRIRKLRRVTYVSAWALATAGSIALATIGLRAALHEDKGGQVSEQQPMTATPTTTPPAPQASTPTGRPPGPNRRIGPPFWQRPTAEGPRSRPPVPRPSVRITTPKRGAQVVGKQGVLVAGTAAGLRGRVLRLLDHAPDGVYYLVDNGPIPVRAGRWSFHNPVIGDGGKDVGKTFTMTIVLADRRCQAAVQGTPADPDGNIRFPRLPPGCEVADLVPVLKVAP